jgi:hypothetical protein
MMTRLKTLCVAALTAALMVLAGPSAARGQEVSAAEPGILFPLDRTAYFQGEWVPVAFWGIDGPVHLSVVRDGEEVSIHRGPAGPLWLNTAKLLPGTYEWKLNGEVVEPRMYITSVVRHSPASLQDEHLPPDRPRITRNQRDQAEQLTEAHREKLSGVLGETSLDAAIALGAVEMGRRDILDVMARHGTIAMANPHTRPISFLPAHVDPRERDGMSQRMILSAQANGRHPNFGGFLYTWDPTAFAPGNRKGLLIYWGWGDQTDELRSYIERQDRLLEDEFRRRTGMEPVGEDDYVAYLLSIDRPEFAPAIDLPTRDWLREIAENIEPMPESERAAFEKRLDAWSDYLMGIYQDLFTTYQANLGEALPSLANSASVQIDHAAVRNGQYHPRAYRPLDFRYQTAWNDQVGGPDYSYQWLFVAGVLEMGGEKKPTWISNAMAAAHGRSRLPGKLARVAAHILPYDGTGIGFALEGFSNILGGMNKKTNWENIRDTPAAADVLAGADFINRFAPLGLAGSTDFGTGVLYSRHQMGRENLGQGYGTRHYDAFVALTRLGRTPRLLTEERILDGGLDSVEALVIPMQTVPLPDDVTAAIERFVAKGGRVLADASTTIDLPEGVERLDYDFTREGHLGKPHSWNAPNVTAGMNDTFLLAERLPELMRALHRGLEGRGQGVLHSTSGPDAKASLLQISGGEDATYVIAVNDSFVRTQADWHQVTETLEPTRSAPSAALLYDVTEQEAMGTLQPFACDLTQTTARLFAVLTRPIGPLDVSATQQLAAGEPATLRVNAVDEAGEWTVSVRSQVDGRVVALPIQVQPNGTPDAKPLRGPLVVREREAIVNQLSSGTEWVIPVFDSPEHEQQLKLARTLSKSLSKKGVNVEIMDRPTLETYYLAYEATDEQAAANERVESGHAIGKIERLTVNRNDWFSGASGYRFAKPVILLDVVGVEDNPMAESLDRLGALWPEVSEAFPGKGRGLVQLVHWAFSPRTPAVVLQADSIDGLDRKSVV